MEKTVVVTEEMARDMIRAVYDAHCNGARVTLELCRVIANWLYNNFGFSVTTLFVERVLKEVR